MCDPEFKDGKRYVEWIGLYFRDCVYTPLEISAFCFGMMSVICFLVAFFPQLYKNFKRKSVDGLSLQFLFVCLLGDISNVLGAFLTNQYPTVKYTGLCFVITELIVILQYFYYTRFYRRMAGVNEYLYVKQNDEDDEDYDGSCSTPNDTQNQLLYDERITRSTEETPLLKDQRNGTSGSPWFKGRNSVLQIAVITTLSLCIPVATSKLSEITQMPLCNAEAEVEDYARIIGEVLAWCSGLFYFGSRIGQVRTNYILKDVEGISIGLFILTLCSTISYGLQIILRQPTLDEKFFRSTLPYLLGSFGTLIFDIMIICQAVWYRKRKVMR